MSHDIFLNPNTGQQSDKAMSYLPVWSSFQTFFMK